MVVTRFAPSPTGYLHIGGLRTALYSYLWARQNGGKFLLRIEDTDEKRNSLEATKAIEAAFKWCGLDYDGEVIYQSQRKEIYKKYIDKLLEEGKAYYCYMSKEELDHLRQKQLENKERPKYDGRYRDFDGTPPEGILPAVRIKAPTKGEICFEDGVKGQMKFRAEDILDDFIIARADGTPTYNFVVAVDDALMGVNHVIRGDDHLSNTPKQIIIYEALGFKIPKFFHIPMILNEEGKKLSKRDGATNVMDYPKMGYLKEALLNFLVRLGWSHKDQEIFSLREMIELFNPYEINSSASAFNAQKLDWLNAHYIKTLPAKYLIEELKKEDIFIENHPEKELLIDSLRQRSKNMIELAMGIKSILDEPKEYDEKAVKKFINEEAILLLEEFNGELLRDEDGDYDGLLKRILAKHEIGFGKLAQPIRIALTGSSVSPSVGDVIAILGKKETLKRVENFNKSFKETK
ncbi:MAG: glutamate--tRNA ligase [Campylobacteraceae bacterium]|jgi:glutamyl-tRNA synthetase|nr:glutamate--tRNA ligase [Campylobacteraceae bacterium]